MGYSREVYDSAMEVLGQRRRKAEQEAAQRRMAFYANCPRGQQIQQELAAVGSSAARRVFAGGNVAAEIAKLREQSSCWNSLALRRMHSKRTTSARRVRIRDILTEKCAIA